MCCTCGVHIRHKQNDFTLRQGTHTFKHAHISVHTHTRVQAAKEQMYACALVRAHTHIKKTKKCPEDQGAIFPLCLNGNHVLAVGSGRLSKVSPSTHYVG